MQTQTDDDVITRIREMLSETRAEVDKLSAQVAALRDRRLADLGQVVAPGWTYHGERTATPWHVRAEGQTLRLDLHDAIRLGLLHDTAEHRGCDLADIASAIGAPRRKVYRWTSEGRPVARKWRLRLRAWLTDEEEYDEDADDGKR